MSQTHKLPFGLWYAPDQSGGKSDFPTTKEALEMNENFAWRKLVLSMRLADGRLAARYQLLQGQITRTMISLGDTLNVGYGLCIIASHKQIFRSLLQRATALASAHRA